MFFFSPFFRSFLFYKGQQGVRVHVHVYVYVCVCVSLCLLSLSAVEAGRERAPLKFSLKANA